MAVQQRTLILIKPTLLKRFGYYVEWRLTRWMLSYLRYRHPGNNVSILIAYNATEKNEAFNRIFGRP